MVYIASWDEFVDRSVRLFRNDPNTTRYVMKYRHCDGKLVLKVTDNKECLKFKTDQAQDARKMEKLNNIFFTLMSRGPDADIAEVTGKEQADAQQGKKGRGRKQALPSFIFQVFQLLLIFHHKVREWYLDSFRDLRSFLEIKDANDKKEFTQMIKAIKVRHNNVVPAMALRVQQLKKGMDPKILYEDLDEIHQFLDRFYLSRIGIRMLIGQHVKLHNPNPPPHVVGYIHTKMSPFDLQVISMEGYGTDAYLHLSRLGDSQEPLP